MERVTGLPTYHCRVETWECDFNGHWNTRFYLRAFRMAGEVVGDLSGQGSYGKSLHIRFHKELHDGAAVEVVSGLIAEGAYAGRVLHILTSDGRLSATALDFEGVANDALPRVSPEAAAMVFPRGIDTPPPVNWLPSDIDSIAQLGRVQPQDVDLDGVLTHEDIVRRVGIASHNQLTRIGFTVDYTRESGIGRMLVEQRLNQLRRAPLGTRLIVRSRLAHLGRSSFTTAHALCDADGSIYSMIEMCMVAVDMANRRARPLPDILLTPECRAMLVREEVTDD